MSDPLKPLRTMMAIRAFEAALSRQRDHGFQLLSEGEEAVATALGAALSTPADQLLTSGRSIAPAYACGVDPNRLMAELLGRSAGTNSGIGGRGHLADPSRGFFGAHAVVGGNLSIAAGVALQRQVMNEAGIVAVLFGDGACGSGSLHEVLNIAALWRLPLLFVCNNNQLSVSTSRTAALSPQRLTDLPAAFGIPAVQVDGSDVEACSLQLQEAISTVRERQAPYFVECLTVRLGRHSTSARELRSKSELEALWARCPIERYSAALMARGLLDAPMKIKLQTEVDALAEAALAFALRSTFPTRETVLHHV